ncbi:carbon starvation protein A [Bacteroidales bacterium OttesenSCG-928-K03]|nr:carbon starvation protein A [Odoribacter sp. OttesenSCG-928-L07]MDL2242932.1 carbon starvation protein A [Bacteroidales bacterium OttesenSCG-928-K03]
MITFIASIVLLILGYFIYGKLIERNFGVNVKKKTPAYTKQDGIDYIPMKTWKIFLIQFLNIAGLGPIFGAIMGAKFGSASFIWIVIGCIFGGAVHDYLAGMISLRKGGVSLPEIHGEYLGNGVKQFMRVFMVLLMILVGVVFVAGPAELLANLTARYLDLTFWIVVIFIYYIFATLLPIDKIIGKIYPVFGICLLFMAFGILISIFVYQPAIPEIWEGLQNKHPNSANMPIFPMMFVSIACGAVSGFHATQSPLMARCMKNEKYGRPVFYGSMIVEGIVALIWAAAASYFFFETETGKEMFANGTNAAVIVDVITKEWLGAVGAVLAIFGVIAAPISTGDTAFRSARLIIADFLKYDQKPMRKRLHIAIPMFAVAVIVLIYSLMDKNGFDIIWRYFSWANQVLAAVTLWAITIYMYQEKKWYLITLIPAQFMTMVSICYILIAPEGFSLSHNLSYWLGGGITAIILFFFCRYMLNYNEKVKNIKKK